ncbi:longevity-assurance protein-like protein [Massariosphaeria phaeospora]|uniref:Longevity-assurance protein-like protein n=1 Tax=Massariosphaeria phaeospora TaxID=100035 RepID=A0A7C8M530_9PLEO|nr:longevity-assurance protein-like protein [Massariosphaeria phaeospora]
MAMNEASRLDDRELRTEDRELLAGTCRSSIAEKKKKKKPEDESLLGSLCTLVSNNQLGISVNLLLLLILTHIFFPRARRRTSKFFQLSYYHEESGLYGCSIDDLYYVAFVVVAFTGARVAVMEYILDPLARRGGIRTAKGLARFKEQAWLVVYCTASWPLGVYILYTSGLWFNLENMWKDWPFRQVTGIHKFYYLVQWGFWIQQIVVVNIEEKRKDYAQMFTHHIFTVALIFLSYGSYQMPVGTVILCTMDIVDIVLPTAKLLKYTGYNTICDYAFGLFVLIWFVTRHVFYPMVCWSVYAHLPTAIPDGCHLNDKTFIPLNATAEYNAFGGNKIWGNLVSSFTDQYGPVCWSATMRLGFLALLLALQVIMIMWFATIIRIVWKVIRGQSADDMRSDDEGEADDVEEQEDTATILNAMNMGTDRIPLEEEVGADDINFTRKNTLNGGVKPYKKQNRRSSTRASGISIPGHGDRKELLGRIGCEKH